MSHGALAEVMTGWTGAIVWTTDTGSGTVTPELRESVASVVARLLGALVLASDEFVGATVSATGVITLTPVNTDLGLTLSGTCETRLALTAGPYSGSGPHVAAGAYEGAWVPARGLKLQSPLLAAQRGSAVGDGSAGWAMPRSSAGSRMVAWDDAIAVPDLTVEHDYWHDGRLFGRVRIEGARWVPLGSQRTTDNVTLELDVREVA